MKRYLVLAFTACGGSSPAPDASVDAAESTGNVSVIVSDRGVPVSGVPVFFRSADGMRTFEAVTASDGTSGFDLEDGTVTVLLPRARYGLDRLYTFAGVERDDRLVLELSPLGPRAVEVTVTVAADAAQPGPIVLYTSCDAEEPIGIAPDTPTTLALACSGDTVDLLAVRVDPDTLAPLASQAARLDLATSTDAVLPGPYEPVAEVTVAYANAAGIDFAHTLQAIVANGGRLFESGAGGSPAEPVTVHRPATSNSTLLLASNTYPTNPGDEQTIYTWGPMPPDPPPPITVDLSRRLPAYQGAATFDTTTSRLAWEEAEATTDTAVLVRARVRFHRDVPDGPVWSWNIVAPRSGTRVQFPPIPALQPEPGDVATVEELTNIALSVPYHAVRSRGFSDLARVLPAPSGSMIVQRLYVPEL